VNIFETFYTPEAPTSFSTQYFSNLVDVVVSSLQYMEECSIDRDHTIFLQYEATLPLLHAHMKIRALPRSLSSTVMYLDVRITMKFPKWG
jgi:hypothetical protein